MNFNSKVYHIVRQIPEGKVCFYGQVAFMAGSPRASRAVGYALHRTPEDNKTPCHRVVFKDGSLTAGFGLGGKALQRQLLEAEGIQFTEDGRVDMRKHCWTDRPVE